MGINVLDAIQVYYDCRGSEFSEECGNCDEKVLRFKLKLKLRGALVGPKTT